MPKYWTGPYRVGYIEGTVILGPLEIPGVYGTFSRVIAWMEDSFFPSPAMKATADLLASAPTMHSVLVEAEHVLGHALSPQPGKPEEGSRQQLEALLERIREVLAAVEPDRPNSPHDDDTERRREICTG